jgi:hypothetical protein
MILSHNGKWIANRTLGGCYVIEKEFLCKHILPYLYVFMCGMENGRRTEELLCDVELKYGGVMDEFICYIML